MFPVPDDIEAVVVASLPQELHYRDGSSEWLTVQRPGQAATSFIEGPAFDQKGRLWFVDIPWGRIFCMSPEGVIETAATYNGEPNGLAISENNTAYIADHRHGIMALDLETRSVEPYCVRPGLERFKGTNDLILAKSGALYFTDQGQTGLHDATGRLYRLDPDGCIRCLLDNVPSPNGLVLNEDESVLYLAVTRDNAVWRVPLTPAGGVTKVGAFIRLSGGQGPDGLAMDSSGNLAVCHLGLGSVWIFDRNGEPRFRVRSPMGNLTTNATFGGIDGKELFVTESQSGSILKAILPF